MQRPFGPILEGRGDGRQPRVRGASIFTGIVAITQWFAKPYDADYACKV
jgi:hypothetical protein